MTLTKVINLTRVLYTILGVVFLTSGIIINSIQFLLYIFLRPFMKNLFRRCNYYLTYALCSQIVFIEQYWAKTNVKLHCREVDVEHFGKEHAMLIMNHSYEIDWMIGWILCEACGILGNVKGFMKKSLQYVPTVGYSWKLGGCIFVERNWTKDQKSVETKIRDLITYTDPIWLFLAAEGTRFSQEKHGASREFAKKNGLPELRYHLNPRTKGFTNSVPILREKISVIYDVTILIKPGDVRPTLTSILLGRSINADVYVDRIPMKSLPEGEAELATWLHSLYKRKDDLAHSYRTGNWSGSPEVKEYKTLELRPSLAPAINFAFWSVCVFLLLGNFLLKLLLTGSALSLGTVVGIIGSFVFLFDKILGETKISNASSYGNSKKT